MPQKDELPFSARYSLPARMAENLSSVSWESVAELSVDFSIAAEGKRSRVKKIIKELELSRLLLLERAKGAEEDGRIDPGLLVDALRLVRKCEQVAREYELDLKEFSSFAYMISEKLKREKLARHPGMACGVAPISEEIDAFKRRSENLPERSRRKKGKGGK